MESKLNFYLITDLHHYASCFIDDIETLKGDQKCLAETGAIIDSAFEMIAKDKTIDIVLIAGDVSNNGEKESHLELIEKLNKLQNAGKKIYLITATHDYNKSPNVKYKNSDRISAPTKRNELPNLYDDFGRKEAFDFAPDGFSYVVKLIEGYKLLCLNDDGNGRSYCGYDENTQKWILKQIQNARENGDYIFAMTHHPVLPPTPIYPLFSHRDMLGDYELISEMLADAGVEYIFTGHTHMQNIAKLTTPKGNTIYDINTGSLVGYPAPIRKVSLDKKKMEVSTLTVDDFNWDLGGKTAEQYLKDHFDWLLNSIFDSAAYDIDKLASHAVGFSVNPQTIYKLQVPIIFAGKLLQKLTFGALSKILLLSGKVDKSIKSIKIKDFCIEIIRNVFYGDEPYNPETPQYKAVKLFIDRLTPVLKKRKDYEDIKKILDILLDGVLYDTPPSDWNAILPRIK